MTKPTKSTAAPCIGPQTVSPSYIESSKAPPSSFETFEYTFDTAIGMGIRLRGAPGGSLVGVGFLSVGELRAFALVGAAC